MDQQLKTSDQASPLVSIVSATRNRTDSIHRLIDSARRQSFKSIEIVIVDDASDQPFNLDDGIVLLRNPVNLGPCGARNRGFAAAKGKYVLLCDDDIEFPDPSLLQRAVDLAEAHPHFGAIGFRHTDASGHPHLNQPVHSDVRVSTTVFYGYCVLFRRDALMAVGGFNESIRYCYEEQELGFRLHDAGWEIMFDPGLTVVHHHDPRGRDWTRIHRLIALNAIRTMLMRFPLLWVVPGISVKLVTFPLEGRRRGNMDLRGTFWLIGQTVSWIIPALRERSPIQMSTLRRYMQLKRHPVPVL